MQDKKYYDGVCLGQRVVVPHHDPQNPDEPLDDAQIRRLNAEINQIDADAADPVLARAAVVASVFLILSLTEVVPPFVPVALLAGNTLERDFELKAAPAGTIVVLHACCHNPTGYDLTPAQWDEGAALVKSRGLVPFLDMAYQGFGDGIAEDGAVIGKFVAAGLDFFVSTSFSKSFSQKAIEPAWSSLSSPAPSV